MPELNRRCKTSMSHSSKIFTKKSKALSKTICVSGIAGIVCIVAILSGFNGSVEGSVSPQGFQLSLIWKQVKQ